MKNRIRNFDIQNKLGSGSYGVIYKAINKTTKEICVLKQISLSRLNEKAKKSAINEATIMGKLVHPFIVRYQQSFIEQNTLNIVMQYCDNGDLNNYLKLQNKRPLKQQKIWRFFIQICVGLEYIHKNKILHRDIKTLNIFMNKNEQIKIGDLGVAKMLTSNQFAQTMVGTPFYLSPELCEEKPYNQKSDIWAMGCLLYELCTFRHPFEAQNQASLILKIIRGKYAAIPQFYSKELKEIIDLCLERDYKRRPTASNILSRPKIQEMKEQFGINKIVEQYSKAISKQTALVPSKSLPQQKPNVAVKQVPRPNNDQKKIIKAIDGDPKKQQIKKQQVRKQNELVKKAQKVKQQAKRQPVIILPPKPQAASQKKMQVVEARRLTQENIESKKQSKNEFMNNLGKLIDKESKKQYHHAAHSYGDVPSRELQLKKQDKRQKLAEKVAQIKKEVKSEAEIKKPTPALPEKKANYIDSNQVKKLEGNKQVSILSKPPIAPSSQKKEGIIKVKNEKAIQAKVYESQKNVVKPQGIIKSGGFSTHIQSKERLEPHKESTSKEKGSYQKIHSAKRPSQQQIIKMDTQKQQKKQLFGLSPAVERKSEKIIKNTPTPSLITEQKRQIKKEDLNKISRVRKGGKNQLARNARNLSRYNEVSKQEQDMIMNLPNNVNKNGAASSDSQQDYSSYNQARTQDAKAKTNKSKFQLKEINDDLVLQKYEDLMRSQEQKTKQQYTNRELESEGSQELNKEFDKQIAQESANYNPTQQELQQDNIVQDLESGEGRKNSGNSNQAIQEALEAEMNVQMEQQDPIQDESKEEEQNQWSYDQEPELPMLQEKESPYFQENNPYLVQQEEKTQDKINHLQIKLQENMKREDEINKLMQLKIDECRKFIGNQKVLQEILQFFRKKLHMDEEYNEQDEKEVQIFLKKKGLTDHYKFQNIYKIMHFQMQLDNTRKIIQRICKKLTQLQNEC